MAEGNDHVMAEVMNLLEAEPSSTPAGGVASAITQPGPDIPALREQLAILVSTGKAKEAIGVQLTREEVKRLTDKDVQKYYKRFETFTGAKTTETLIESFVTLTNRAVGMFVRIKDVDALQNELIKDYIITKELSALAGGLALSCERLLAVVNVALIITKHINFSPLDEAPVVEQSSAIAESSANIC